MHKVLRTNSIKLVIYSPIFSNVNSMINNDLHIMHANFDLKLFQENLSQQFIEVKKTSKKC